MAGPGFLKNACGLTSLTSILQSPVEAGPSPWRRVNCSTALTKACRKRRLSGVFGKVRNYFLIMFLYYQICAT